MRIKKLSVLVPEDLARFVDAYRREHGLANDAEVVARALEHLRAFELEQAYAQSSREVDARWDVVADDGL
jgi:hypothetical protein